MIVARVNNEELAVTVSDERQSNSMREDNRRFQFERPDWTHQNQQFRFGEGDQSDMIVPLSCPGLVWDEARQARRFFLHPKHGGLNQRFEYRPNYGRLICKEWGDAVTRVAGASPLVAAPCEAARADSQRFEIRFQIADVAAQLRPPPH